MTDKQNTIYVLSVAFSGLSVVASSLTLILIRRSKKWTGYLAILCAIASCQIIDDITFPLSFAVSFPVAEREIIEGIKICTALNVALWTNILSFLVLYAVVKLELLGVFDNVFLFCGVAFVPGLVLGGTNMIFMYDENAQDVVDAINFWVRVVSIIVNFALYGVIFYRSRQIISHWTKGQISSSERAIIVLTQRMVYYPIAQVVSRLGVSLYQLQYGFDEVFPSNASTEQFTFACIACILHPLAGIGYFLIFLVFQPRAYEQFTRLVSCKLCYTKPVTVDSDEERPQSRKRQVSRSAKVFQGIPSDSDASLLEPVYGYSEVASDDDDHSVRPVQHMRVGSGSGSASWTVESFAHLWRPRDLGTIASEYDPELSELWNTMEEDDLRETINRKNVIE